MTSARSRKRRWGWRTVLLAVTAATVLGWFLWWRVFEPTAILAKAKELASDSPLKAERLAAEAIAQSGGDFPAAQLFRARLLGRLGHWEEAAGQFSVIRFPNSLPAIDVSRFAVEAQQRGFYRLANNVFNVVKSDASVRTSVLRSLIQLHLRTGNDEVAVQICRELLDEQPQEAVAWQVIGTVAMNQKRPSEAEEAFLHCLRGSKNKSQRINVLEDLVQVRIDRGDLVTAREALEQLVVETGNELSDRAILTQCWILRLDGQFTEGAEATGATSQ